jgi:predicted house-cleaning noncanonical NTP pyrophosphatase (MazG superfamily)
MTTSRNISSELLERELAGLTAAEPHEPGLWAAALERSGTSPRSGSVLTRTVPVWATGTLLGLIVMTVLVSFTLNGRVAARRMPSVSTPAFEASERPMADKALGTFEEQFSMPSDPVGTTAFAGIAPTRRATSTGTSLPEQPAPPPESESAHLAVPSDRHVIRKAQIDIRTTDNVRIAFMKAQQVISEAGGEYIENAALTGEGDRTVATITLRVAAARLSEVLGRLRELGVAVSESATGEDVTDRIVDLEARLRNEQRVEEELLELLQSRQDASLADVLQLRTHIASVREEIERLIAQRDRLGRLVALATILVSIQPAAAPIEPPAADGIGAYFAESITKAWNTSLRVLVDTAAFLVRMLVGGIVWWVLLIIVVLGLRAAWNKHARAAAAEPAPTA